MYCALVKDQCPERKRRDDDTPEDWGCPNWWDYVVERTPNNGGQITQETCNGCMAEEHVYNLMVEFIRIASRTPAEMGAMREEQEKNQARTEQVLKHGFVGVARALTEEKKPRIEISR